MKSTSTLLNGFQSKIDNDRGHEIIVDLPQGQGGKDIGATALELAVMSLSGCISTIFALVAQKSRLEFEDLKVEVDAKKGEQTIESADVLVSIKTADSDKANKVLDQTMKMCPVGVLFDKAGVKISHKLVIE